MEVSVFQSGEIKGKVGKWSWDSEAFIKQVVKHGHSVLGRCFFISFLMVQGIGGSVDVDSNSVGKKGILCNTETETFTVY